MQDKEFENFAIEFLYNILNIEFKNLSFNGIEEFKNIKEYEFYLVNLIGIENDGSKKEVFFKIIKKGKIKESLFCICDLIYEEYFNKEISKEEGKITILEENQKNNYTNKISVNLSEKNFSNNSVNVNINFIEMSKVTKQLRNLKKKGWDKYIEINPKDILILGVKNKC